MFCSPIQQVDPFSYSHWSPAPSRGYRQSCRDSHARAVLQEQARREALAERRAYEAYMRKEAERRRAAEEEAAAVQYKKAVMDRIIRAYAAQAQAEQEGHQAVHTHPFQYKIPILSNSTYGAVSGSDTQPDEQSEDDEDQEEAHHSDKATTSEQHSSEFARDLQANKPKISYEEAVAIVQKHAQIAITIRRRLSSLNTIRDSFQAQQRAFRPPQTLDFDIRKSQKAGQPVLAYTPNNRPLQAYEESLLRLLTDLDDVPSGGLTKVKNERKALARTIQSELDRVDNYKMRQWQGRR